MMLRSIAKKIKYIQSDLVCVFEVFTVHVYITHNYNITHQHLKKWPVLLK